MRVTKVNGQELSRDLLEKIKKDKQSLLQERMEYASLEDPYAFSSTGDQITVLFEPGEKDGLVLPLQTNVTRVTNLTDYSGKPGWNWLKSLLHGRLEGIQDKRLEEFLDELERTGIDHLCLHQRHRLIQGNDYRRNNGPTLLKFDSRKYLPEGSTLQDKLSDLRERFVTVPDRFLIDPQSHVRVEKRITRNGSEIYEASLDFSVFTGISGRPPLTDHYNQTIRAELEEVRSKPKEI